MKFNWKANWEILLVLAIIVVGIVITTIAAIRNKDKHILTPDDSDFGQLLVPGSQQESLANQVLVDQRQNSLNSAPSSSQDEGGGISNGPMASTTIHQQPLASSAGPKATRVAQVSQTLGSARGQSARSVLAQPDGRQSKLDDSADFAKTIHSAAHTAAIPLTRDQYDALSTEATPSSILPGAGASLNLNPLHLQHHYANQNRRQVNRSALTLAAEDSSIEGEPVEMMDDIHTTRSSLANEQLAMNHHRPLEHLQGLSNPSLALHGPYGSPTSNTNPLLRHHQTGPLLDMDELMGSYTRSSNLTEGNLVNDYSLAAALNSSSHQHLLASILAAHQQQQQQYQQAQQPNGDDSSYTQQQTLPQSAFQRTYTSGTSHLATLLGDLLKMTRPQQQQLEGSTTARPQTGILQQLRALPSPLQSLLQALTPGNQGPSTEQLGLPNHETSESSQHYQRVLMSPSDLQSSISRSLRSSSTLPAYPAPKGTPQNWIPPTAGGDPSFHALHNSQADFVASNSAGFLRHSLATNANQQSSSTTMDQQLHGPEQQQLHHQQQAVPSSLEGGIFQQQQQHRQLVSSGQHDATSAGQQQSSADQYDQPGQIYVMPAAEPAAHRARANLDGLPIYRQQNHQVHSDANYQSQASSVGAAKQHQSRNQMHLSSHFNHAPAQPAANFNPQLAPANQLALSQQQQRLDLASSQGESKLRATVVSGPSKTLLKAPTAVTLNNRRKRSADRAARYGLEEEDEDDADSSPLSVVSPDGQPMSGGRLQDLSRSQPGEAQLVSQSQRLSDHLELGGEQATYVPPLRARLDGQSSKARGDKKNKKSAAISAAGSDLMTRLLTGMSSNLDELDDPELNDEDEEAANERRKEALEDAEFGISNSERRRKKPRKNQPAAAKAKKLNSASADARLGSGSSDSQSYASRRQQQRSDIEFYGHPGEETRQLKYGILGSGNYEVVNGGIYPEADESTAAVNSVANYVRKPGATGLLSTLPKLLAENAGSSSQAGQSSFLPGARLSGGFMRGSSDNSEGLIGLLPSTGESLAGADKDLVARPLLEFIDAQGGAGQLFDANLLAQLGSSGSSAKTVHAEANANQDDDDNSNKLDSVRSSSRLDDKPAAAKIAKEKPDEPEEGRLQRQSSSISSSRSRGLNQFNSYQISPSKKVTIFSDQDLDSAPSDLNTNQ